MILFTLILKEPLDGIELYHNFFYSLHEGFGRPIIEALQFRNNIFVNKRHPAIYRVKNYRKCIKFFSDFYELENLLCSFNKNSFEKPMIANYTPQELNELNF